MERQCGPGGLDNRIALRLHRSRQVRAWPSRSFAALRVTLPLFLVSASRRRLVITGHAKWTYLPAVNVDTGPVQPAPTRRHDEGDQRANVLRLAKAGDVQFLAVVLNCCLL